ncbi:MAG: acyl carrier protein [Ignavibacteriales bacterium]|jgi:acyl carrier protein|nr:acyl carrier protein [Ignavibacteriales bacterium]MBK7265145.1 acyl carrier protein [Ignavibacteriales bacterium]MBP9123496.1 acyl carrier protein [Ignavibacteriaceae bacterium]MCC6636094.1 acyl carrier protein [Ignavibacteriaceae bacterium]
MLDKQRNVEEKLGELYLIINQILGYKNRSLDKLPEDATNLRDVGLDSLDLAELTVKVEHKFGVDVFEDGLLNTFGELYNKLNLK